MKIVEVELVGETGINGEGGFRRGVSVFPALGDSIYRTVHEDLELVYARPAVSTVRIGTIHQDQELPAYIATDDLLGKHLAVLGTTGSGKSCAVALILHAILDEHPNGHVVLLDPHNEYSRAFGERAEVLSPGNLKLPYWLFNFEEIVEVILGKEAKARAAETAILNEVIPEAKRIYLGESEDGKFVTVDTPIPYQLSDLVQLIDEAMGKLDNPENSAPYMRLKSRFNALRRDSRFAFMFGGLAVRDNMTEILSRIFRIPVAGKPITIMDLSGIPSEILNVVVSVLCRMTFDFALWSERAVPIMLVCEEAHRYAPQDSSLGFEDRQGRTQIRRLALHGDPAPLGAGLGHSVPVQHHLRPAYGQPERSGVRARHPLGVGARVVGFPAVAKKLRGHCGGRGCLDPGAPMLRHPAGRAPAQERHGALLGGLAARLGRRGLPRPGGPPLAAPAALESRWKNGPAEGPGRHRSA
jgi:hypothetical protein